MKILTVTNTTDWFKVIANSAFDPFVFKKVLYALQKKYGGKIEGDRYPSWEIMDEAMGSKWIQTYAVPFEKNYFCRTVL